MEITQKQVLAELAKLPVTPDTAAEVKALCVVLFEHCGTNYHDLSGALAGLENEEVNPRKLLELYTLHAAVYATVAHLDH